MIYLGFLLHVYQPPNQFDAMLNRITEECYRPLFNLIVNRKAPYTVNINWSLTEKLLQKGHEDVVETIGKGLKEGILELTGSAAYHAILPLIPEPERKRQLELNAANHANLWKNFYKPRGLFPPELAFGHEIVSVVKNSGFQWLLADDVSYSCLHGSVPYNFVPQVEGLGVLLRSGFWSNRITLEQNKEGKKFRGDTIVDWIVKDLDPWFKGENGYLILAMDGETFGHHHPEYIEEFVVPFLDALSSRKNSVQLVHLSKIYDLFPKIESEIPPGSWSTSVADFWEGNFFPLWKNPKNQAHHLLWQLTQLALESVDKLRGKMDRSLNSCTFWWAATQPEKSSPITLSGMDMLLEVIRLADSMNYEKAKAIHTMLQKALKVPQEKSF